MCLRVIVVTLSVCPVCLSVADLEDGELLALQRDMNLNWMTMKKKKKKFVCEAHKRIYGSL